MELGGNKNASEYFEANGMMKDGRPDHEAAPHAKYKMELAAKADLVCATEAAKSTPVAPARAAPAQQTEISQVPLSNPFEMPSSDTNGPKP